MAHADQFAKRSFADQAPALTGGALRWRAADLDGLGANGPLDRGALLSLTLSWHQIVPAHLVDADDRVDRRGPGR